MRTPVRAATFVAREAELEANLAEAGAALATLQRVC